MTTRRRLLLLPSKLSVMASGAVAVLLLKLSRQTMQARLQRAAAIARRDCDLIRDRYPYYVSGRSGAGPADGRRLLAGLTTAVIVAPVRRENIKDDDVLPKPRIASLAGSIRVRARGEHGRSYKGRVEPLVPAAPRPVRVAGGSDKDAGGGWLEKRTIGTRPGPGMTLRTC